MDVGNKKLVLLVEDEPLLAMTVQLDLEDYGYDVVLATSGEEAIKKIRQTPEIQLILMDINLGPGIDGTETASIILKERDIPIVFCSNHTEPEIVELTEKITSYGYVVKSSSITVLDASIKMAFKLFEAKRRIFESDIRQKTMISNISDVIGIIDQGGIIKYKSSNVTRLFGWSPEELFGTDGWLIIHPNDIERIQKALYLLLKHDNSTTTQQCDYKCKDGTYKPIEITATNLINDPIIRGILLNYHDISERIQAEQSLELSNRRFQEIFDQSPIAIEFYDAEGCLREINSSCLEIFGIVNKSEVIGFNLFEDPNLRNEIKQRLLKKECVVFESTFDFEEVKRLNLYQTTCSGEKLLDQRITPLTKDNEVVGYILQLQEK